MKRNINTNLLAVGANGRVHAEIDGKPVETDAGKTIWEAANENGIAIPALCHQDERMAQNYVDLGPVGVCRLCCVEVREAAKPGGEPAKFGRILVPSCMRPLEEGMAVRTKGGAVDVARKTLVELLVSDHPKGGCERHRRLGDCELELLAEKYGLQMTKRDAAGCITECTRYVKFDGAESFMPGDRTGASATENRVDRTNPMIRVDHTACILCDRCVRACTDVKQNKVIGRMGKGHATSIGFDLDVPMGDSSCVNCGECMITCPTGAITYAAHQHAKLVEGREPTVHELLTKYEIFKGVSASFLELALGGIRIRQYRRGEELCRQGEYGSTAFYVTRGDCDVFIRPAVGPSDGSAKESSPKSALAKLLAIFSPERSSSVRDEGSKPNSIAIDATVDLKRGPNGQWVNTLHAGDLVGEMVCMNFQPRSATVVAASDDVEAIEVLRNVLDLLRKNKAFREKMDAQYRERVLAGHLRNVDLFKDVSEKAMEDFQSRAELVRLRPGAVLWNEGDTADCFYVVRTGHIKVYREAPGGTSMITYLRRGEIVGEIGALGKLRLLDADLPGADGRRTAGCAAMDHAELIRFDVAALANLIESNAKLGGRLKELAEQRLAGRDDHKGKLKARPARVSGIAGMDRLEGDPRLTQFLEDGLYQAQNMLVLDLQSCTRCDECVKACAESHGGIARMIRDGTRFENYLVAASCRACFDPVCMVGCPVGSIRRDRGLEILIEDWCIGCGLCEKNCPFGSISMVTYPNASSDDRKTPPEKAGSEGTGTTVRAEARRASVCDLSRERSEPACVYACPHDAAHRVSGQNFLAHTLLGEKLK